MVWTHIAPKKMIGSDMRSMVDLKRFELSTSRMRKDFENFFGLFFVLFDRFRWILLYL